MYSLETAICYNYQMAAHAVENERKWRHTLLLFFLEVCIPVYAVVSNTNPYLLERVSRRQTGDIYYFINSSGTCNSDNKTTYLINENQCVKDQELSKGTYLTKIMYKSGNNFRLWTISCSISVSESNYNSSG